MLEYWPNSRASPRPCIHAIPNLVAYELLTRWSELVALTSDDLELLADGTMRVIIRRSKSDPFGQGRISLNRQGGQVSCSRDRVLFPVGEGGHFTMV